jgi:serine/threonine-protein kinase
VSLDTRYKILEKIGSGSFATVYRARDMELGREVAIKQLHQEFVDDPSRLERFWQEAQLLASLQHPNIVTIFDIVKERGWLVLELMQGSLAERLSGRQIDLRALRATLAHVLRALKYLHSQGIIHGDIKPGNLMIDARRRVKLGDFGLACRVAKADGSLLKGTTKYMAPETVSDDFGDVGPASDLYSLGFSAYDLMCGPNFEELFPGLNAKGRNQQVAWMMWHAAPDRRLPEIGRVLEGVPPDLAKVVQKLTQKDQAERYHSADEALSDLQIDLKLVGQTTTDIVPDEAPPNNKRRTYIAGGALAVSVLMSAAMLFTTGNKPQKADVRKSRGLIHQVTADKNEFVVQDLNSGSLEPFKVPRKQRIFLMNEKKNILLSELQPGDHVEMDIDKDQSDLVVNMMVDRPVRTPGTLKELALNESRLVLSMEVGNTRDDLPLRVPETAILKLNGQSVRLRDLQLGDRLEVTHLSEPGEIKGRVLNTLNARRLVTSVGSVAEFDADKSVLAIQVGQGAGAGSLKLPVAAGCKVTINGLATHENAPLTPAALKAGDRVSIQHDTEIVEIAATRSLQFDGVVQAVDLNDERLTVVLPSGERHTLLITPKTEITLALDKVKLTELRQFDNIRVAYSEAADGTLTATTVDARRPPQTDRWTLVLGTQSYTDPALSPLKSTLNDARLVHGSFLSRYAVSDQRGALIVDGNQKDWERQIGDTLTSARPQTQVILYIVGHAYQADDKSVYLAPKDFKLDDIAGSGLSLDWLATKLNECPSKDKILILDVTPPISGKDQKRQVAGKALLAGLKTPLTSTTAIIACDEGQQSRIWDEQRHGLFAWTLAQAIRGAADTDRDLHLTPEELFGYLKTQSENAQARVFADQTPILIEPQK